ncbi:MAG: hypothetical protein ACK4N5_20380, partial [Myxococcales bacterium]
LVEAVERFERNAAAFDPAVARQSAERFDRAQFKRRILALVERYLSLRGTLRRSDSDVADLIH